MFELRFTELEALKTRLDSFLQAHIPDDESLDKMREGFYAPLKFSFEPSKSKEKTHGYQLTQDGVNFLYKKDGIEYHRVSPKRNKYECSLHLNGRSGYFVSYFLCQYFLKDGQAVSASVLCKCTVSDFIFLLAEARDGHAFIHIYTDLMEEVIPVIYAKAK
ncbi:MAG: hypothetical protein HY602_01410 [Parcubacteria group bacterium]|nr:hypothetical protein [Parcubacteria group bacterium]